MALRDAKGGRRRRAALEAEIAELQARSDLHPHRLADLQRSAARRLCSSEALQLCSAPPPRCRPLQP